MFTRPKSDSFLGCRERGFRLRMCYAMFHAAAKDYVGQVAAEVPAKDLTGTARFLGPRF